MENTLVRLGSFFTTFFGLATNRSVKDIDSFFFFSGQRVRKAGLTKTLYGSPPYRGTGQALYQRESNK
jgi:hypothetical protein